MLRILKLVGGAATAALIMIFGAGWWYATSEPASSPLALPSPLLDVRSTEGQSLLESTPFRIDHDVLLKHFVTQSRRGYCGVASGTIVVNALHESIPPLSQDTFFTARATAVRSSLDVTFRGMTLEQLADLLRAHDLSVSVVYASESNLETFRSAARASLMDASDFLLVNYDRVTLHQQGSGHISPVVAYHAGTDRFLVLDVASYKYPPTWVPATDIWNAMNVPDTSSGKSRGFLLIRNAGAQQAVPADAAASRSRG
jgi:hypothetical protein